MQRQELTDRILRPAAQAQLLGISRTTLWRLALLPNFPKAVKLGAGSTGRFEGELLEWLRTRQAC